MGACCHDQGQDQSGDGQKRQPLRDESGLAGGHLQQADEVIQGWLNGGIQIPRALRTIAPSSSHFQQEAVVAMQATDDLQVMGAGSERGDLRSRDS